MSARTKTWTVKVEKDPQTGELILPIPDEIWAKLGLQIGDTLVWEVIGDHSALIRKAEPGELDEERDV